MAMQRAGGGAVKLSTFIPPLKIRKCGIVIVRPEGIAGGEGTVMGNGNSGGSQHDNPLQMALSRAFYWQRLIDEGLVGSGSEIAKLEGLHHSTVNELPRMTLLEPATIQRILAGQQPRCMSLLWFQRNPLPLNWALQRQVVEGFDA
ncbi:MAG: hypothetical protein ACYC3N_04870 [Halothiobacillus sp.]